MARLADDARQAARSARPRASHWCVAAVAALSVAGTAMAQTTAPEGVEAPGQTTTARPSAAPGRTTTAPPSTTTAAQPAQRGRRTAAKPTPPTELWKEFPLDPSTTSARPRPAGQDRTSSPAPVAETPGTGTTTLWGVPTMAVYAILATSSILVLLFVLSTLRQTRAGGRFRRVARPGGELAVAGVGRLDITRDPDHDEPRGGRSSTASPLRRPEAEDPRDQRPSLVPADDAALERQPEVVQAGERIAELKRDAARAARSVLDQADTDSAQLDRRAAADAERAEQMLVEAEDSAQKLLESVAAQALQLRRRAAADAERAGQMRVEAERSAEHILAGVETRTAQLRRRAEEEATRRLVEEANQPRVRVRRFDFPAVMAVIRREVIVFLRTWRSMTFAAIVEPTIFLLAFGLGIGALIKSVDGYDYIQFVGTGVVATTVVFSSAFPSMFQTFVKSRFQKLYDSILATPTDVPELVTAEMLWTATRTGVYALAPVAVAVAFGLDPHWGVALVPFIAFITAFGFAGFGITIAAQAKAITSFNYIISGLLTPLLLVAGAYFPVDTLPDWAAAANNANPLYHCVELVRDAVFGIDIGAGLVHVGALLLFGAITWWLAVHRLRPQLID